MDSFSSKLLLVPPPERRDSARQGNRAPYASDSAGKQRIYIIETPKDSPRPSLGLAVSYALSRLWYYCGHFCERYEWKVFLDTERQKALFFSYRKILKRIKPIYNFKATKS